MNLIFKFFNFLGSWWKSHNLSDLPLRTIKTLVYIFVEHKGDSILDHFTLIENKDESELSFYVQKAMRQHDSKSNASNNSAMSTNSPNVNLKNGLNKEIKPATLASGGVGLISPTANSHDNNNSVPNGKQYQLPNDFPLSTRLSTIDQDGNSNATVRLPVIQNEVDLKKYVTFNANRLDISINFDELCSNAVPIESLEQAQQAVLLAEQRLRNLKDLCRNQPPPTSTNGTGAL